jgi:hypothetical protein
MFGQWLALTRWPLHFDAVVPKLRDNVGEMTHYQFRSVQVSTLHKPRLGALCTTNQRPDLLSSNND